jgi:hypothetical protein
MDTLLRFLLRLILVPLGAVCAVAAAMTVIVLAHRQVIAALLGADPQAQEAYAFALVEHGPLLVMLLGVWSLSMLGPAAVGALIAEALAVRSWMFHAANGGLSAWLGWTLTDNLRQHYRLQADPQVLVAAGLAAGFAYWLIAGWTAGFWKPLRRARSASPQP